MRSSILSGETQSCSTSSRLWLPIIKSGLLRALGTGGTERSPILPDVPTFAESGVDFQASLWVAFMAPKATPQPIIDLLNQTVVGILNRKDIKDAWQKQGATPMLDDTRRVHRLYAARDRQMGGGHPGQSHAADRVG